MLSMTGYGSGEAIVAGLCVRSELRAVNHRFLDVAMKLPPSLAHLEVEIRNLLKERLARGRVSCFVQIEREQSGSPMVLDEVRLGQGIELLQRVAIALQERTGHGHSVQLEHLLAVPDLFRSEESAEDEEDLRRALFESLEKALAGLVAMKTAEGREMVADLERRLRTLAGLLKQVREMAPRAVEEAMARLRERLDALLQDQQLDPQRLAQETIFLADRTNINEECERLACHIDQFGQTLAAGGQAAKRLNFLLQEMHREVNTMGSKTNLMEITQAVISMKDEVESMREQIQNLE